MAISLDSSTLQTTLQTANPLVPLKSTLQILYNFKIHVADARMHIRATDLDNSITASCDVAGEDTFDIAVNARKLFDISRQLPAGEVQIYVEDNVFYLQNNEGFSCKIACVNAQDFPQLPEKESVCEFDIDVAALRHLIHNSTFAASKDESRGSLCGVLWSIGAERMGMVSTDGHRLGRSFTELPTQVDSQTDIVIYPRALHFIEKNMAQKEHETLHVCIGNKYIFVSNPQALFCSKLINATFPDYQNAIPQQCKKEAVVEKQSLVQAIKRVSILTSQNSNLVKFTFQNNTVTLEVLNKDIGGEAKEVIEADYDDSETHVLGFNSVYFIEILTIIDSEKILLKMNNSESPCLIFKYNEDDKKEHEDDLYLIMPLKILEE